MKKQLIIVAIIVIFLTIELSGCNEKNDNNINGKNIEYESMTDEERLIGIWDVLVTYSGRNFTERIWEFRSDHTFTISYNFQEELRLDSSGAWNISNNSLILTYTNLTQTQKTLDYFFSNNYNTITITDKEVIKATYIFNRQF